MLQLQHTPLLQSSAPGLHPVSIHQMAPPVRESKYPITAYYSVYRPRKDERLSRPGWLVTCRNKVPPAAVEPPGHGTHPSTNRARCRVTSLIRPTPLPLCHAATVHSNLTEYHHHHHHHESHRISAFYRAHYKMNIGTSQKSTADGK